MTGAMITNSWSHLRLTMITAALLLAGVIIDVSLLHWAMITVTIIAITAAIRYHDIHVVMTMRMSFDVVVVSTLSSRRRNNVVHSLRLSSGYWDVVIDDDDRRHGRRPSLDVQLCRLLLSVVIVKIRHIVWGHAITMSIYPGDVSRSTLCQRVYRDTNTRTYGHRNRVASYNMTD